MYFAPSTNGRAPDVPVVAAVDDAELGGQVRDAHGLVEEDVGLEVEVVRSQSFGSGFLNSSSPTAMNIGSGRPVAAKDANSAG